MNHCLHCEKSEELVPLLKMQFQGKEEYICPQCLPVLIHKAETLADKLPGMHAGKPAQHEH